MSLDVKSKIGQAMTAYLKDKKVLIFDKNKAVAQSFRKLFNKFEIKSAHIHLAQDIVQARELIEAYNPEIIILSYEQGDQIFKEIEQQHIQTKPDRLNSLFILTSHKNSKFFASYLLTTYVDLLISKPISFDLLENEVIDLISSKIKVKPNELIGHNIEKAYLAKDIDTFQQLITDEKSPQHYLSHYYMALNHIDNENKEQAINELYEGLSFKSNHFKSLSLLSELLVQKKHFPEAMDVFKQYLQFYPLNRLNLFVFIQVCIATKEFDLLIKTCEQFSDLGSASDKVKQSVAAGLALASDLLIKENENDRAIELLKLVGKYSLGKKEILSKMTSLLVEIDQPDIANEIIQKYKAEHGESDEFKLMEFECNLHVLDPAQLLREGTELARKNIKSPLLYKGLIKASIKIKRKQNSIDDLIIEAQQSFPQESETFKKLL